MLVWWHFCYHLGMRIVVDTNVFVGACLGNGSARQVIAACLRGQCTPVMGTALFLEYEDVLSRSTLFQTGCLSVEEREELFDIFLGCCEWTRIYYGWRPNSPDAGDDHLIELAIAAAARCVVSRNQRDLKRLELRFPSLAIVTPEQLLDGLREG